MWAEKNQELRKAERKICKGYKMSKNWRIEMREKGPFRRY